MHGDPTDVVAADLALAGAHLDAEPLHRVANRHGAPSTPRSIRSPTLRRRTESTYCAIKDDILKGRLPPESLLLEHELATRFGVSKTPIREALRRLISEGWVLVMPRRGYFIRQLRIEDVREVWVLRQAIEPSLLAETSRRATAEDLDALLPWIDAQRAAADDRDRAVVSGSNFHLGRVPATPGRCC
ncbi:GntR family transcriptional regulator (plasmid) [Rhodococcus sp. USK10]|uniref:GntR family transcriptional regulator n=1 Tax=Rhodococcus sp. USK10 TaxID=2789739 RepID=UPI001C602D42|nr:GntR family transcriptional regulator [Rhodococcus sp. USK10]QYB00258.1 GntR family transcriptional regulator [Rhodococcus sp. USK10]